jgi:hypothetical protein
MPTRHQALLTALAVALTASGCGDPYAKTDHSASRTPTGATASRASVQASSSRTPRPAAAVRAFANAFINWKFDDLPRERRRLADRSTGTLRDALLTESEQALSQSSRRVSNQANSGQVQLVGDPDPTGTMLVVTRETARLGDLKAQSGHFIYQARVRRDGNSYKLTEFKAVN